MMANVPTRTRSSLSALKASSFDAIPARQPGQKLVTRSRSAVLLIDSGIFCYDFHGVHGVIRARLLSGMSGECDHSMRVVMALEGNLPTFLCLAVFGPSL